LKERLYALCDSLNVMLDEGTGVGMNPDPRGANGYMAYSSEVRSRFTTRLLAALLLPFLTFGAAESSMFSVSVAKTVVSARQRARRAPRRLPRQSESAVAPTVMRTIAWPPDSRRTVVFLLRSIFQRPPPSPSTIRVQS
jgi:hypothetical protein